MRLLILLWVLAAPLLVALPASAGMRLIMFEQEWCSWCARWHQEVGDAYPTTEEGRRAPLLRVDIDDGVPEGVTLARRATFTPTFVLVSEGHEIGRIEGYPGEDFFWAMLGRLLEKAP